MSSALIYFFCSVFVVDSSNELPEEMTSFVRLLMMSAPEWAKAKRKSKVPRAKVDNAVLSVATDVLRRRLAGYPTSIEAGLWRLSLHFSFTPRILG